MSDYSVLDAKSELEGMLHGTTLDQITGINQVFDRAARQLLLDLDPQETKKSTLYTVFDGVYDYEGITDLKGNKIIDFAPQANRQLNSIFIQMYQQEFDIYKGFTAQDQFSVQFNNANKTLRVKYDDARLSVQVSDLGAVSSNGTWAATAPASDIEQDTIYVAAGASSLKFNLAAGANPSAGYIENSTLYAIDLSQHENFSSMFLWVYLPTASDFTSVNLRWGSATTDYWSVTVTENQQALAFQDGWNLLQFPWLGASSTGSPDSSSITYSRITFNYNGTAQTGVHVDSLYSRMPILFDVWYYSKFLFRDATTGAFQETVTDDSNLINLDTETYNVYLWQVALQCAQQQNSKDASFDMQWYMNQYASSLAKYKTMYRAEVQKPTTSYYQLPNNKPNNFLGWGNNNG